MPAHRPENRAHFASGEEARLHGGDIGDRVRVVDSRPARADAADASPQACVSDCFQKKISTAAPNSRPRNRPQQPGRRHPAHGSVETRRRAAFPFLEMPDSRYINDGFQVLLELGAVGAV